MRGLILLILAVSCASALAQTAQNHSLSGQPMEINATGGTNYVNGLATAHENVAVHINDTDIYGDDATYNPQTKDVRVEGNVRIYRGAELYVGSGGTYNLDTKRIVMDNMRTLNAPFYVQGGRTSSISEDAKLVERGSFTTHDAQNPDFQVRASTVRIYEGDRVILKNAVFYIGRVPIFYWPYLYQSLEDDNSFLITPAFTSSWGPSVLSHVTFPITDDIKGTLRLDYRSRRGPAIGFAPDIRYGKDKKSFARINTYFVDDSNPTLNRTSLPRDSVDSDRYRLSVLDRTDLGKDWSAFASVTKLSDAFILQDFFPGEFRVNPQPDNIISVNHWNPLYSLTAFGRGQVNNFYETTERMPEIALDVTRHPIFGSGINYEGETSYGFLRRNFPTHSAFQDYHSVRLDSFHQFTYPKTYFGWLSVVPRLGFRGTYYSESRDLSDVPLVHDPNPLIPDFLVPLPSRTEPLIPGGDRFRTLLNTGAEVSFKASQTWEQVQSRALGLDGLRHIIQPFANYSLVAGNNFSPAELLQFDRYIPSTRLRPIDFPQFNAVDTIDNWSIMRVGVRNRFQTRRDDSTINWIETESYLDFNIDNPYDRSSVSNLFNTLHFNPVPWAGLDVTAQLPLRSSGFTEINTDLRVQPIAPLSLSFSHRFLSNNPFFADSDLYYFGAYYRVDANWGAGGYARYEANTGILEEQRYTVYRDLQSWVASVGAVIRDNGGVKEYGLLVTFTLKALPKLSFDFNYDPRSTAQGQNSSFPVP
ncbi:MAG: hypothetical protein M3032_10050 [Verrucomicrobiota bacterium]|nr:hypothetical protein [Verrucomicrobiota bacterium]